MQRSFAYSHFVFYNSKEKINLEIYRVFGCLVLFVITFSFGYLGELYVIN